MNPLRIAFASPEMTPLAKTGGLGDVAGALTTALHRRGHDVRPFLPYYPRVRDAVEAVPVEFARDVPVTLGQWTFPFTLRTADLDGMPVYFVDCPPLFDRPALYTGDPDEHLRFTFFSKAVLESCQRMGFSPHIVHANDWQTALLPVYVKHLYEWDELFRDTKTVFTIHNIGYQGTIPADHLADTGLADRAHLLHQEDLAAGRINLLATGLLYADLLTTVSPTYAREIRTADYGAGLEGLLQARADHLVGVLNGIDADTWNPATDPHLAHGYDVNRLEEKEANKRALLAEAGLPYRKDVPLLGVVSRLAWQKGFDLMETVLPKLILDTGVSLVVLGSGEPRYETFFRGLEMRFRDQVSFHDGFDEGLAHRIEAGADLFLMPSRYEPCGLNQMYSLRYGTVPVVRRTGGLADTVVQIDPATGEGNGILFEHFTAEGFDWAVRTGLRLYRDRRLWRVIQRNGMAEDFGWDRRVGEYEALYRTLTDLPQEV